LVQFIGGSPSSFKQLRQLQILKLEEERDKAKIIHAHHQQLVKSSVDADYVSFKSFQLRDLVLKWDKECEEKGKHTKFQRMWLDLF